MGVRSYLNKKKINQEHFIAMDFLCHGVPSNKCFSLYKKRYENKHRHTIDVDFRYKDFKRMGAGWHDMFLKIYFDDQTYKELPFKRPENLFYYKVFIDDLAHRLSCFKCNYHAYSMADITIGDFWAVNELNSTLDDNKGISFVKIHTNQAELIWENLRLNGTSAIVPYKYVAPLYNNKKDRSANIPRRNAFLKTVREKSYNQAVISMYRKELLKYYTIDWLKTIVKKILKRT
jgi:hypothetical protein